MTDTGTWHYERNWSSLPGLMVGKLGELSQVSLGLHPE